MAASVMSLIKFVTVGPSVSVGVGWDVPDVLGGDVEDGTGGFVGNGVAVGRSASVADTSGEQAANPLTTPNAPTFNASLRVNLLILVMGLPLK
jgi:hypothetical protein